MADFPPDGARIRAVSWAPTPAIDDNVTVPPGTLGTVTGHYASRFDPLRQIHVKWDNGSTLSLVHGPNGTDQWEYA